MFDEQVTYNITYVKLYLKEIPYAATSLGISSIFLVGFLIYLILFLVFLISVKIKNSSWCIKDEDDPMSVTPRSHTIVSGGTAGKKAVSNRLSTTLHPSTAGAGFSSSNRTSFSTVNHTTSPHHQHPIEEKKQTMNRNQKVMFFMVISLVSIQILALCVRLVSDVLSITIGNAFKNHPNSVIVPVSELRHQIVTFFVFSSAELGLTFGNMITTLIIMCFVLNVL